MAPEIIKQDVKIINISDKSKYLEKDEEIVTIRTVTFRNESKTLTITITEVLDEHILGELQQKTDINLEASLVLKLGDPFQKKIM